MMHGKRGEVVTLVLAIAAIAVVLSALLIGNPKIFGAVEATSTSCGDVNGSFVLTSDVPASGTCFNLNVSDITFDCNGFFIISDGTANSIGINATNLTNVTIKNCNIFNFTTGIRFLRTNNSFIINTNVTNSSQNGILLPVSYNNTIENVTIVNEVPLSDAAINIGGDQNMIRYVYAQGVGAGLFFSGSNNTVFNSTASTDGGIALELSTAHYNTFINDLFISNGGTSISLETPLLGSRNNTFINTTIKTNGTWINIATGQENNFTNTLFDGDNGSIRILPMIALPVGGSIDITLNGNLYIASNRVFLNASMLGFLNTSAEITLRNLSFATAQPTVDFSDSGTFVTCPASICTRLSYNNGVLIYNVTHFTSYSSNGSNAINFCPLNITFPGNYTLGQDLISNGTCITIFANNTALDCRSLTLIGNGSGNGIFVNNSNNITIANCNIRNFSAGIFIEGNENSTYENNTVRISPTGISTGSALLTYFNNTVKNNSIFDASSLGIGFSGTDTDVVSNSINNSGFAFSFALMRSTVRNNRVTITSIGMDMGNFNHNLVENNTIFNDNCNQVGIRMINGDQNNTLRNNTINMSCSFGTTAIAVNENTVYNNTVVGNLIVGDPFVAINIGGNANGDNRAENNTILTGSAAQTEIGINTVTTFGDMIIGNLIVGPAIGIKIGDMSDNTTIFNNTINNTLTGIYILNANRSFFNLTWIENATRASINISNGSDTNFTYTTFVNPFNSFEQDGGGNSMNNFFDNLTLVRNQNFSIGFGQIFVNGTVDGETIELSTNIAAINVSANSLNQTGNVSILVSRCPATIFAFANFSRNRTEIVSRGTECNAGSDPSCTNIACNSNRLNFTASHFSSFAAGDACGDINTSTNLINNVFSNGTCFNITGSNLILDCAGFNVTYANATTGNAIKATGRTNITVKNCIIFTSNVAGNNVGINLMSITGALLLNNTITTNGSTQDFGIWADTSNDISTINNTVNAGGSGANNVPIQYEGTSYGTIFGNTVFSFGSNDDHGIALVSSSSGINVTNNSIISNGTNQFNTGILAENNPTSPENLIAGNDIHTDGSDTNYGIYVHNSGNATVENNTISTFGSAGTNQGIVVLDDSGLSNLAGTNIVNNTIFTNGTSTNYGIDLLANSNQTRVINNSISSSGSGNFNLGIQLQDTGDNLIQDNTIHTFGTDDNLGFYLIGTSMGNTIVGNHIFTNGTSNLNEGLSIQQSSSNNTISNNTIITDGTNTNWGMDIETANNTISYNNVSTMGSSSWNVGIGLFFSSMEVSGNAVNSNRVATNGTSSNDGIQLNGSINNLISNNTVSTDGLDSNRGIGVFASSNSNNFIGNNITTKGTDSYGIFIENSNNSVFIDTAISEPSQWIVLDTEGIISNFTNTTLITADGSIDFTGLITVDQPQNVTFDRLNISFNRAFLNSTNLTFFNTSAEITLLGLPFASAFAAVDFEDDGTFFGCVAPQCVNISYTGGTFVFNVSGFTTYVATDVQLASPTSCGIVTQNLTLGSNVASNGTCFTMNASNVTLDCAGFSIGGDGTGIGINATDIGDITIENCFIENFSSNILLWGINNSFLINNTALNSSNESILLQLSNGNLVANNTANGTGESGIELNASSNNILSNNIGASEANVFDVGIDISGPFTNVAINSVGDDIVAGFALVASDNNTLLNNTGAAPNATVFAFLQSSNNTITNSLGTSNEGVAFLLSSSNGNTITNAIGTDADGAPFALLDSNYNNITNATATSVNNAVFYLQNSNNNTIANSTATTDQTSSFFFSSSSDNSILDSTGTSGNSTVTAVAIGYPPGNAVNTAISPGANIYVQSGSNTILNNNIVTSTIDGAGIKFSSGSNNNLLMNNLVTSTYTSIRIDDGSNNLLMNNTANTSGNGFVFTNGDNNTLIGDSATLSLGKTALYFSNSNNNTIINTTGVSDISAFFFDNSNNNIMTNVTGISNDSSSFYFFSSSSNNVVQNSVGMSDINGDSISVLSEFGSLTTNTNSPGANIFLNGVANSTFVNDSFPGNPSTALKLTGGSVDNIFSNITVRTNGTWIATEFGSTDNNMTNTLFDADNGSIRILPTATIPDSTTINLGRLNISQNLTFMNSSNLTFMNTSAIITLNNINFVTPFIKVDFEDDGTFDDCSSTICTNLSYSNATFVFNVTHFTSYGIGGSVAPVVIPTITPTPQVIVSRGTISPCPGKWKCTDWGPCQPNETQTRTCVNQTGCLSGKPSEREACVYIPGVAIPAVPEQPTAGLPEIIGKFIRPETAFAVWLTFSIFVVLAIAIVVSIKKSWKKY